MKVAVIGLGIVGSAVSYFLERAGHTVIALHDGNPQQSAGRTRIFRTLHQDLFYIQEARIALGLWQKMEEDLDVPLLQLTGLWAWGDWTFAAPGFSHQVGCHPLRGEEGKYVFDQDAGIGFIEAARRSLNKATESEKMVARVQRITERGLLLADGREILADFIVVAAGKNSRLLLGQDPGERKHHVRFCFPLQEPGIHLPSLIDKNLGIYGVQDSPSHYAIGSGRDDCDLGFFQSSGLSKEEGKRKRDYIRRQQKRLEEMVQQHFPGLRPEADGCTYCLSEHKQADGYEIESGENWIAFAGTNLYKFAPRLGQIAANQLNSI